MTHAFPTRRPSDLGKLDRAAIARLGLTVRAVADTVAAGLGGRESGLVYEGDRRFDVTVRVPEATRANLDDIRPMPVLLPEVAGRRRAQVPLAQVARIRLTAGRTQISRDTGKRPVVFTETPGERIGDY